MSLTILSRKKTITAMKYKPICVLSSTRAPEVEICFSLFRVTAGQYDSVFLYESARWKK